MTTAVAAANLDLSAYLRAGDRIVWSQGCGEPQTLVEALVAQAEGIGQLSAFAATSFSGLLTPASVAHLRVRSMGAIGALRTLSAANKLDIVPCHISQIAPMIAQDLIGCDVAFVQVSPPDARGDHSYGLTYDFIQTAVAKARLVIAEINDQIPFTYGDAVLPASKIDVAVHVSRPPVEVQPAKIGEIDAAIAEYAARFIEDGAVLQVGIGAVPDAILQLIRDRRDLGVHSGMVGDGLVDLVEAGVVTNARKPIDAGVSIAGVLIGTQRLYKFADRNAKLGMRCSAYTNNEAVLSRLEKLVTINSALEVDLTGQVNAEQSGGVYLGGTGGQVDFVRAGVRAPDGHSIIALPATAKGGSISRIAPALSGPVTTTRTDVDVVVTEFGVAELRGQSLTERARRLVHIAHPDFREALDRSAHAIAQRGF